LAGRFEQELMMPIRLEGMTLYTVKDIEELLGIGNSTVRRYIAEGRLKGRKMARRWYIPAESLLDYFKASDLEPPTELLEKLKELEEKIDQQDRRRPLIRARSHKSSAAPPPVAAPIHPPAEESLSDVERLLAQARRLKEEAARLEQIYGEPDAKHS
jgi:excisionase family DNA binding protein